MDSKNHLHSEKAKNEMKFCDGAITEMKSYFSFFKKADRNEDRYLTREFRICKAYTCI